MNPLVETLHHLSPIPEAAKALLQEQVPLLQVGKNRELLSTGQISRSLYFVKQGVARVYYYHKGVDISAYFAIEGQFIGGVDSLFSGRPSNKAIQVLEPSEVYALPMELLEELCSRYHEVERLGRKLATFAFLESQSRLESIQFLTAKERYAQLEQKYPGLVNRIALRHIASYLGITAVSLSRIRAEALIS
ncbi:MAG: Crp/Fnr family transcriptional regulator [Rufibacter sp.]